MSSFTGNIEPVDIKSYKEAALSHSSSAKESEGSQNGRTFTKLTGSESIPVLLNGPASSSSSPGSTFMEEFALTDDEGSTLTFAFDEEIIGPSTSSAPEMLPPPIPLHALPKLPISLQLDLMCHGEKSRRCSETLQGLSLNPSEREFLSAALSEFAGCSAQDREILKIREEIQQLREMIHAILYKPTSSVSAQEALERLQRQFERCEKDVSDLEQERNSNNERLEQLDAKRLQEGLKKEEQQEQQRLKNRNTAITKNLKVKRGKLRSAEASYQEAYEQTPQFKMTVIETKLSDLKKAEHSLVKRSRLEKAKLLKQGDVQDVVLKELERRVGTARFKAIRSQACEFFKLVRPFTIETTGKDQIFQQLHPDLEHEFDTKCFCVREIPALNDALAATQLPTVDVEEYLKHRISHTALELIRRSPENTEVFFGSDVEMRRYYENMTPHFNFVCQLAGASSCNYFIFEHSVTGERLVIMNNILSEEALFHRLLQLKMGGVEVAKIRLRGNLQSYMNYNVAEISKKLKFHGQIKKVLIIGNCVNALTNVIKLASPTGRSSTVDYEAVQKETRFLGSSDINFRGQFFKTPAFDKSRKLKDIWIGAMAMPNGGLSGKIVSELLAEHNIDYIIMVGAGGSLKPESRTSHFQLLTESTLSGTDRCVKLTAEDILYPCGRALPWMCQGKNITVNSILQEDREWVASAKGKAFTSTDVESYHIMQAVADYNQRPGSSTMHKVKIVPGLFISDVIGHEDLLKKISAGVAYPHLGELLELSLTTIANHINKK